MAYNVSCKICNNARIKSHGFVCDASIDNSIEWRAKCPRLNRDWKLTWYYIRSFICAIIDILYIRDTR